MKTDSGIAVGQIAEYECDQGYKLIGSSSRECQLLFFNPTWSGDEPICTIIGNRGIQPVYNL